MNFSIFDQYIWPNPEKAHGRKLYMVYRMT